MFTRSSSKEEGLEQLREIVASLATSAGRKVGSAGHDAARRFLLMQMSDQGLVGYDNGSYELPFPLGRAQGTNLVGVLPGSQPGLEPVLLAAHYDTCGSIPGADDNAAAIAILLSIVSPLRALGLDRSVLFAFFDAEEPPFFLSPEMGSTYFYDHQRRERIHCALVLDLVGHDVPIAGWEDLIFVTGLESDPQLESIFRRMSNTLTGFRALPTLTRYIGDMSDYRPFRLARRPYLFFSCGRWEHYHRSSDTAEKLNYEKMAAFSRYVAETTRMVAEATLEGPFEGHDTTRTELQFFRSVAAPLLRQFGLQLRDRADLDRFVARLMASYSLN